MGVSTLTVLLEAFVLAEPPSGAPTPPVPEQAPSEVPIEPTSAEPLEVHVLGDGDDNLQKVPGSRALLTKKEVDRTAPRTSAELLRRMPSLTVTSEDPHGLRLNVGLRGLDPTRSRSILVLEDGVPIAINPYAEPDLYYSTPLSRIAGIELVKGSGAVLFGPQTIGGVLNFLTHAPPDQREFVAKLEAGDYGFVHGYARYGDSQDDVRYLVSADFKRADGPREIGFHALDVMGKAAFPTGPHGELLVKVGGYNELSASTYVGLTRDQFEANPEQPTLAPDDQFHVRRFDLSLTHREQLSETVELRTLAYGYVTNRTWRRQRYDRQAVEGVDYTRVEGDPTVPLGAIYFRDESMIRDRHYQVAGLEPMLTAKLNHEAVRQTLTAGVRGHLELGQRDQRATDTVRSNAGESETLESQKSLALALFAQDRIAFRDWLLVTPGVRLEHAAMTRGTQRELTADGPRDVDYSGDSSTTALIPGLSMLLGTPDFNGFGGIHVGYSPPRISSAITPEGQDQALSAERSTNYEAGVRVRPTKGISLEATGFLMVFQNQIVPATASSGVQSELVNGGSTVHRGAEGSMLFEVGRLAAWPEVNLDLALRYTYALATYQGGLFNGNVLPYAPAHHGSASLAFEHEVGVGAQASYAFTGPQFTDEVNSVLADASGRVGEIPLIGTLDLVGRYTYAPWGLTAGVSVKNVVGNVFIETRRPDGIHTGGFRQIIGSLQFELPR
jgi:Fe(3+) dicitrate transport protein